jgi:hypothetical protein
MENLQRRANLFASEMSSNLELAKGFEPLTL